MQVYAEYMSLCCHLFFKQWPVFVMLCQTCLICCQACLTENLIIYVLCSMCLYWGCSVLSVVWYMLWALWCSFTVSVCSSWSETMLIHAVCKNPAQVGHQMRRQLKCDFKQHTSLPTSTHNGTSVCPWYAACQGLECVSPDQVSDM